MSAASPEPAVLAVRTDPSVVLGRHPWPPELVAASRPLDLAWSFDLAAAPAQLWPLLIDTSRFNRALGFGKFEYREEGGRLHGATRNAGMSQAWVEAPWNWVGRKTLSCVRSYSRGFAHHLRVIYELEPGAGSNGTRLLIYFGFVPRGRRWRLFLRAFFPPIAREYARVLTELDRSLRSLGAGATPYERPSPALAPAARVRLDGLAAELAKTLAAEGLPSAGLERLTEHLRAGDELELHRLQVYALARRWRLAAEPLLEVFLHATRAGLLNLSWDVVCPHCRGVREAHTTLGELPTRAACAPCGIDFDTAAANAVEVTFQPHPSIRSAIPQLYCAAEPATKLHIQLQLQLASGERRRVETALEVGRYRLRVGAERRARPLDVVDGATIGACVWRATEAEPLPALAPAPTLELVNDTAGPAMFVLETARWGDDALRPGRLFTLQRFRDLFSEQYLDANVQLSVGEQTILFTDMIGSTRFYDTRGDAEAFAEVRRHFAELYALVRAHRGAVVKTIGDAVMAAFADPTDALQAAAAIHARFPEGRTDSPIRLRISMNRGPCIAVNLDAGIDFFGRTVNVAAKLQACVEAGQTSFPRSLLEAPGVAAYLEHAGARLEPVTVTGKTLGQPIEAYRWDLNPPEAGVRAVVERPAPERPAGAPGAAGR